MKYCVQFIFYNKQLLLLKRKKSNPFFPNIWTPVIGKIKPNEQPIDAVIRETKEETGLSILKPKFVKHLSYEENIYWFYHSHTDSNAILLNHENDQFDFFELSHLPQTLWPLFKEVAKEL